MPTVYAGCQKIPAAIGCARDKRGSEECVCDSGDGCATGNRDVRGRLQTLRTGSEPVQITPGGVIKSDAENPRVQPRQKVGAVGFADVGVPMLLDPDPRLQSVGRHLNAADGRASVRADKGLFKAGRHPRAAVYTILPRQRQQQ